MPIPVTVAPDVQHARGDAQEEHAIIAHGRVPSQRSNAQPMPVPTITATTSSRPMRKASANAVPTVCLPSGPRALGRLLRMGLPRLVDAPPEIPQRLFAPPSLIGEPLAKTREIPAAETARTLRAGHRMCQATQGRGACAAAEPVHAVRRNCSACCRSTETSCETPCSAMVTPNSRSIRAMVRR